MCRGFATLLCIVNLAPFDQAGNLLAGNAPQMPSIEDTNMTKEAIAASNDCVFSDFRNFSRLAPFPAVTGAMLPSLYHQLDLTDEAVRSGVWLCMFPRPCCRKFRDYIQNQRLE